MRDQTEAVLWSLLAIAAILTIVAVRLFRAAERKRRALLRARLLRASEVLKAR